MALIVATAQDYAYGPAARLLTVTERLAERGHDVVVAARGASHQLAARSQLIRVECLPKGRTAAAATLRSLLAEADLLVSHIDPLSVREARRLGCPVAYIDGLFWLWHDIPAHVLKSDLYIRQVTVRDTANLDRYSAEVPHLLSVGPIVDDRFLGARHTAASTLMINFGGLDAMAKKTTYSITLMEVLAEHLDLRRFDRVLVVGAPDRADAVRRTFGDPRVTPVSLSHHEFLRELARSSVLCTTPGLGTPLEAWVYGVPTVFMPPASSSQYLQLEEYRRVGVAAASVHLADLYPPLAIRDGNGQAFAEEIDIQVQHLGGDTPRRRAVGSALRDSLDHTDRWPELVAAGRRYISRLGGNGLPRAVAAIEDLLSRDRPSTAPA